MARSDDRRDVAHAGRPPSPRERSAKAPLSAESIVDAALAILQSEGLEAVTMRRVAAAVDTGPASLYVYVAGREGLLRAMLDRVVASVELEAPDAVRWRAQLHSLANRLHAALVAHPGIASIALVEPPTTEGVLLLAENMLGLLLAGGVDPRAAAWGADIIVLLVTGTAREDDVRRPRTGSGDPTATNVDDIRRTFAGLPPDRFPLLAAHAEEMVAGDNHDRFHFAIDVVLDGMAARRRDP